MSDTNDSIPDKTVLVDVQSNGIIRRHEDGHLIGRLTSMEEYEYLQEFLATEETTDG